MKRRHQLRAAVGAGLLSIALVGIAAPASAATVLNRFERSCYLSCSAFVQVNGPYQSSVGSNCVTYTWFGNQSSYQTAPGHRCP